MAEDNDFIGEVVDPENFSFNKEIMFSHPTCVTIAYHKVIEAGSHEMIKGFWDTKLDKYGNAIKSYNPDSRLIYINCVKTLYDVCIADYDDEAKKNIKKLLELLEKYKQECIDEEEKWFLGIPPAMRRNYPHMKGSLNNEIMFYHSYVDKELETYRQIFREIELQLKRTKYLKKKIYGNDVSDEELPEEIEDKILGYG